MSFRRSLNPVVRRTLANALLGALSAVPAAALLDTPTVHLYTNDLDPTPDTVVGDFEEAAFAGYAADALPALIGPVRLSDNAQGVHGEVDFLAGAVVAPGEVIQGYYVTDDTGATLYMSEKFAEPVPIAEAGDFLSLDVIFPEPGERSAG